MDFHNDETNREENMVKTIVLKYIGIKVNYTLLV